MSDTELMVLVAGMVVLTILSCLLVLGVFNRHLSMWACTKMGWHYVDAVTGFDGCSIHGVCVRCGKDVMQDSQGNWF